MEKLSFVNKDNKKVYYLKWEVESPKAVVVIAHGMVEHPARYDHFAKYLNDNNIKYINTYFDLNTDISIFDLVIGLHCCEACELVIRNCVKNDKEFAIVLCEVNRGLENDKIRTRKPYIDYLKGISCKLKMTKLPIFEPIECLEWGETIYLKKERK